MHLLCGNLRLHHRGVAPQCRLLTRFVAARRINEVSRRAARDAQAAACLQRLEANRRFAHSSSVTSTSKAAADTIEIRLDHGLPLFEVPLPSRAERCRFVLRPIGSTVGNLCDFVRAEDRGVEIVACYSCGR